MELRIYYYEKLLSLKSYLFMKFIYYENLELHGSIYVFSLLRLGRILISDLVVADVFMHSFLGMILF